MVCIYCSADTQVVNSRLQKKSNSTWRRRRCRSCGAVFTSQERAAYDQSLAVQKSTSHITSFVRDLLFLSIYDACRHRVDATRDATALTETILGMLLREYANAGLIKRDDIVATASTVLRRFDPVACVHYLAFHPLGA
jgi:transcriptional regulator NrdR family protein